MVKKYLAGARNKRETKTRRMRKMLFLSCAASSACGIKHYGVATGSARRVASSNGYSAWKEIYEKT